MSRIVTSPITHDRQAKTVIFTRCAFSHLYPERYLLDLFNSRLGKATEAQKEPWIAEVGVAVTGGSEIKLSW